MSAPIYDLDKIEKLTSETEPKLKLGDVIILKRTQSYLFKCIEHPFMGHHVIAAYNGDFGYAVNSLGTQDPTNFEKTGIFGNLQPDGSVTQDTLQTLWYHLK